MKCSGRNISLNKKGIAIVWLAIFLPVFLFLAGIAIDLSYMYVAKNELQVAADAACLAGVAELDGTNLVAQPDARELAWEFACKNTAAGEHVFLETDGGEDHVNPDCKNYPGDLNSGNALNGDIVVGNWNPNETPKFLAATDPPDVSRPNINALRVVARRTPGSPGGPVGVFIGKIFRLIGSDRGLMSARADATCRFLPPLVSPFPLCRPVCGIRTDLTVVPPNVTPGKRFFLRWQDGGPNMGWTAFFDPTSNDNIQDYIRGITTPPAICNECIMTTEGVINPAVCAVRQMILSDGANWTLFEGTPEQVTIFGWRVLIPILLDTLVCPGGHIGCIGDPGNQPGDPFFVTDFADVIITDAIPPGNCPGAPGSGAGGKPGIVIVGTAPGPAGFSSLSCVPCDDPSISDLTSVKLVE